MESSQWKSQNHLFSPNISLLIDHHSQFLGVYQGMKQTYQYLWCPFLFFHENRTYVVCFEQMKQLASQQRSTAETHMNADCLVKKHIHQA